MKKKLVKGNEALAQAAIEAGCRFYFGYPITPQNDIPEYLAREFPKLGGTFLQAESEIGSINMVLGAAAAGMRAMTSSSGPGISLMQEGLSYLAGSEIPAVVVNVQRSGPGLGGISPSQGDYFQATKGGGHGDYRTPVLAPASVQEMWDLTFLAFDLADRYRNPVVILADAMLGQMKEPLEMRKPELPPLPAKDWILEGCQGRDKRLLKSLYLGEGELEKHCWRLWAKYEEIKKKEVRCEAYRIEDAELVVVAFGSPARIAKGAIMEAREQGLKVGLLRPITLYPYPEKELADLADQGKTFLVTELNVGQMVEDVRMAAGRRAEVHFYGRPPGAGSLPSPEDILHEIQECYPGR
jgi:2-oxoglutarate ferredoxin oxidoreductase subunit alpha